MEENSYGARHPKNCQGVIETQSNIFWKSRLEEGQSPSLAMASPVPMPDLMWRWLRARGIQLPQAINSFLSPSLSQMKSPLALRDMQKGLDRLKTAFERQENICIYGDYDLDGSSGIALLVAGLRGLGFKNVSFYQPSRFIEGYGIHSDALEVIAKRGDKIVISVDCGITAIDEAKKAQELGLDLIITDHHLPRGLDQLPSCVAVINPNRGNCESGLTYLSGVGVGFYLLLGLKPLIGNKTFDLKSLLDLFAIGTVSDMVPLINENRVLIKHGLKLLSQTQRPGLQALITRLELTGRDLDSQDIAFSIAPKLNALSRLELGVRPLDVFMCEDFQKAQALAEQVIELNNQRKKIQLDLEEKILAQVEAETHKPVIVLAALGHAGVVGLVATKVTQTTGKPAFIVAWHEGEGIGSARGLEQHQLPTALAAAASTLERFGGHAQAAGFSLAPDNFAAFKAAIERHYSEMEAGALPSTNKVYDVQCTLAELTENFMTWLKHAGPFGTDNPTPVFRVKNAQATQVKWLKDLHLKLVVNDQTSSMEAIMFFARGQAHAEVGEILDLLVEPSWNYWRGQKRLQLLVRDLKALSH